MTTKRANDQRIALMNAVANMKGAWSDRAACRGDTSTFLPPRGEKPDSRRRRETRALAICWSCPVMVECRVHALEHGEAVGVWGGLREDELIASAVRRAG